MNQSANKFNESINKSNNQSICLNCFWCSLKDEQYKKPTIQYLMRQNMKSVNIFVVLQKLKDVSAPGCTANNSSYLLTSFPYEDLGCVNPEKYGCNCIVPGKLETHSHYMHVYDTIIIIMGFQSYKVELCSHCNLHNDCFTEDEESCGCGYCANSGVCYAELGYCSCQESFFGASCETGLSDLPKCGEGDLLTCYNRAECKDLRLSPSFMVSRSLHWTVLLCVLTGSNQICDCTFGWVGAECDLAKICNPSPCEPWETCRSSQAFVDSVFLSPQQLEMTMSKYQCFGKYIDRPNQLQLISKRGIVIIIYYINFIENLVLEEQMFGAAPIECDPKDNSTCRRLAGSYCVKLGDGGLAYCTCPFDKPLSIAESACIVQHSKFKNIEIL